MWPINGKAGELGGGRLEVRFKVCFDYVLNEESCREPC